MKKIKLKGGDRKKGKNKYEKSIFEKVERRCMYGNI